MEIETYHMRERSGQNGQAMKTASYLYRASPVVERGANVRIGSFSTVRPAGRKPIHVGCSPVSGGTARGRLFVTQSRKRHMQCSKGSSIRLPRRRPAAGYGKFRDRATWQFSDLMTNSYLVGCSTGRSAGFVPFRILPT